MCKNVYAREREEEKQWGGSERDALHNIIIFI